MKGFLSILLTWAILFSLTSCTNLSGQPSRDNTTEESGVGFGWSIEDAQKDYEKWKGVISDDNAEELRLCARKSGYINPHTK